MGNDIHGHCSIIFLGQNDMCQWALFTVQFISEWAMNLYINEWSRRIKRTYKEQPLSEWERVQEGREGTMILVDWGICRIHKVLLAQSQSRARWFGNPTFHHHTSLSLQHPYRERNHQCPQGIDNFSSSRFPPTYVGFGISYILGNLIKAKINVP